MKHGRKQFIIISIAIALVSIAVGGYFTFRKGIWLGDHFLYQVSENRYQKNEFEYVEQISDDTFVISAIGEQAEYSYQVAGNHILFTFPDGKKYDMLQDGDELYDATAMDSDSDYDSTVTAVAISAEDEYSFRLYESDYIYTMYQVISDSVTQPFAWWLIPIGIVLYAIGMWAELFPEKSYLTKHWRVIFFKYKTLSDERVRGNEMVAGWLTMTLGWLLMSGLLGFILVWINRYC